MIVQREFDGREPPVATRDCFLSFIIRLGRCLHTEKDDGFDYQQRDQEYPQMEGTAQNNDRDDKGAGKEVNGNLFFCRKARAALDTFYTGAEKAVSHDPLVKPVGTLHKTKGRAQQKGRCRQYRKDNTGDSQRDKDKSRYNE
jgi:hypothetical protein